MNTPDMTPEDFGDIMGAIEDAGGRVVRVERTPAADEQHLADVAAALLARLEALRTEVLLAGASLFTLAEHSGSAELEEASNAVRILIDPTLVEAVRQVAATLPPREPETPSGTAVGAN